MRNASNLLVLCLSGVTSHMCTRGGKLDLHEILYMCICCTTPCQNDQAFLLGKHTLQEQAFCHTAVTFGKIHLSFKRTIVGFLLIILNKLNGYRENWNLDQDLSV